MEHVSGLFGLTLNRSKCVVVNLKRICPIAFEDGTEIEEVSQATYLGVAMSKDADSDKEVQNIITDARWAWYTFAEFWKKGTLSIKSRLLIYNALIMAKISPTH